LCDVASQGMVARFISCLNLMHTEVETSELRGLALSLPVMFIFQSTSTV
jgi:hypothetical protein